MIVLIDKSLFKLDITLGYKYALVPNHPCANKQGKVYEHVYEMYKFLERTLEQGEVVHHLDRNKTNNNIDNLELMISTEHAKLHHKEDENTKYIINKCLVCGKEIKTTDKINKRFCSKNCVNKRDRISLSKDEIELLRKQIWEIPTSRLSKIYGITDVAIAKRCKKYGIKKPPRGYWKKIESKNYNTKVFLGAPKFGE